MLLAKQEGEDNTTKLQPPASCKGTFSAKVAMLVDLESDLPLHAIHDDNPRNHTRKDQEVRAQKQEKEQQSL